MHCCPPAPTAGGPALLHVTPASPASPPGSKSPVPLMGSTGNESISGPFGCSMARSRAGESLAQPTPTPRHTNHTEAEAELFFLLIKPLYSI